MQKNSDSFRKFIEDNVLEVVKKITSKGDFSSDTVQKIASLTLDLIKPEMTLEQLYQNAVRLDDDLSELAPVVMSVMKEYEQTHEKKGLETVSQLIKSGQYDDAHNTVKKILAFKSQ